ncbi:hypothetical protein [Vibrio sonorensis]|uniref:hypothetical protein n=1 Tax=Vibrio sonorensis TaxID=1004316 RepID=UPI0015860B73|nr:hypothetical protein [Vibrio sonorensis]
MDEQDYRRLLLIVMASSLQANGKIFLDDLLMFGADPEEVAEIAVIAQEAEQYRKAMIN